MTGGWYGMVYVWDSVLYQLPVEVDCKSYDFWTCLETAFAKFVTLNLYSFLFIVFVYFCLSGVYGSQISLRFLFVHIDFYPPLIVDV